MLRCQLVCLGSCYCASSSTGCAVLFIFSYIMYVCICVSLRYVRAVCCFCFYFVGSLFICISIFVRSVFQLFFHKSLASPQLTSSSTLLLCPLFWSFGKFRCCGFCGRILYTLHYLFTNISMLVLLSVSLHTLLLTLFISRSYGLAGHINKSHIKKSKLIFTPCQRSQIVALSILLL